MLPPSRPQLGIIWQDAWSALDRAYGQTPPRAANLRLNGLLTDLVFSDVALRQYKPVSRTQEVAQELSRYLERLRGRTKPSERVTLNSFFKLSEEAQQILCSMIALETRGVIDNFVQIDFDRPDHHQALLATASRARNWIAEPQGRPKRDHLNDYFEGVTELFKQIPNAELNVSNHFNGQPKTPFETILHAGHRITDFGVSYHATVKAYHRR
jgi:hypothetical protein